MEDPTRDRRSSGAVCCSSVLRRADVDRALHVAPALRALSDPTRLQILGMLARSEGSLCACEIESAFDLSQPTISHHLRQLRGAGLVKAERRGTWMHYEVVPGALERFQQDLEQLLRP